MKWCFIRPNAKPVVDLNGNCNLLRLGGRMTHSCFQFLTDNAVIVASGIAIWKIAE